MNEILLPNEMTLDEHVERILLVKQKLQLSVIEMAETIGDAVIQMGDDTSFQTELAERIGMSQGTLSKWVAIGSNQSLLEYRSRLPGSFNSLYQLTVLDNQYQKHYGESQGTEKFISIIQNEITPDITSNYVVTFQKEHRDILKKQKNGETSNHLKTALGESKELDGNIHTLPELLAARRTFHTMVFIPTKEQLSRWRECELDDIIAEEYPYGDLREDTYKHTGKIIFKTTMKDIETAIKCLYAFGFVYRDTLIPENVQEGFNKLDSPVFVIGERGHSKSDDITLKSASLDDVLSYGETTGASPYLLVGTQTSNKNWSCSIG